MDAWIFDVVRTPRGRGREGGALSKVRPVELLGGLYRALGERSALQPRDVDDVVLGCSTPRGELGANLARVSAMYAGWGERASGVSVNRFCASGLAALAIAASRVACGMADVVLAGGIEHPSRVPMMSDGGAWFEDRDVAKRTGFVHMAVSADVLATRERFTREELDAYALESQARAARAQAEGAFARTLVPVVGEGGAVVLDRDECVRATTAEKLAAMPPLFPDGDRGDAVALARFPELGAIAHRHTAGTSPAMADGAALAVVASRAAGERLGLAPRGRVLAFAEAATDPVVMLDGNPLATTRALERAGLGAKDVDVFEVNESFAAVPLHFARALGVERSRLDPNGGAIALGHPLGATGVVLLGTLLDELDRRRGRRGVVSICAGTGIASAIVVERLGPSS